MISAYQLERDRWLLTQGAVRAIRVRALLDRQRVDLDRTEAALGYRLRQHHVGLVSWMPEAIPASEGLTRLDRLTTVLADELRPSRRGPGMPAPASDWSSSARTQIATTRWSRTVSRSMPRPVTIFPVSSIRPTGVAHGPVRRASRRHAEIRPRRFIGSPRLPVCKRSPFTRSSGQARWPMRRISDCGHGSGAELSRM
jgi:hypothetical protein